LRPGDFNTDIKQFTAWAVSPTNAAALLASIRVDQDEGMERVGVLKLKRLAQYQIEGVFPATTTLQELQCAITMFLNPWPTAKIKPAGPFRLAGVGEELLQFDLAGDGQRLSPPSRPASVYEYVETY